MKKISKNKLYKRQQKRETYFCLSLITTQLIKLLVIIKYVDLVSSWLVGINQYCGWSCSSLALVAAAVFIEVLLPLTVIAWYNKREWNKYFGRQKR